MSHSLSEWIGGCLCGSIRYRASGPPIAVLHCHCSLCRRATGAPFVTWITFPAKSFSIVKGSITRYRSTANAERSFCARCGSTLTFQQDDRNDEIDVTVGTLDEPGAAQSLRHI